MTPADQQLFEAAPRPLAALSADGQFTLLFANEHFLASVELRREDLVGRRLFDLFGDPPDDVSVSGWRDLRVALARLLAKESSEALTAGKFALPHGAGRKLRHWRIYSWRVGAIAGSPPYLVQEISPARAAQDLRTPLSLILGPLEELLDRGGLDPSAVEILETVRRNAQKLQQRLDHPRSSARDATKATDDSEPYREPPLMGSGPTIVVASGDGDERAYLEGLLRRSGFGVRIAGDAEKVIRLCQTGAPALLLCDAALPPNGGLELTRRLRDDERTTALPIMLISSRAGESARIEGYDAGADEYLEKPFGVRELIARIDAAVRLSVARTDISNKQRRIAVLARLASVVETAMDAVISINGKQEIVLFNAAAEEMFRCPVRDALGRQLDDFIPHRFRGRHKHLVAAFGRAGVSGRSMARLGDLAALRADGTEFPIEASISQARVDGEMLFTVILRDISERKAAMETQHLLIGELDHRVKNTLAMVQAIASQTARTNIDPQEFAKSFNGRIRAMATAHTLLTRAGWAGADLGELIREQLTLGPDDSRIACHGAAFFLEPQFALHFGLV